MSVPRCRIKLEQLIQIKSESLMKYFLCLCSAAVFLTSCGSSRHSSPMRVERWDASSQSWVATTPGMTPAPSPAAIPAPATPAASPAMEQHVASTPQVEPKRGLMGRVKDAASAPLRWVGIGGAN